MLLLEVDTLARVFLAVGVFVAALGLASGVVSIALSPLFFLSCSYSSRSDILKPILLSFWLNIVLSRGAEFGTKF